MDATDGGGGETTQKSLFRILFECRGVGSGVKIIILLWKWFMVDVSDNVNKSNTAGDVTEAYIVSATPIYPGPYRPRTRY